MSSYRSFAVIVVFALLAGDFVTAGYRLQA